MAIARIFAQARATPERLAVVHNGVDYTYAQLARGIEDARRLLAAHALRPASLAIVCAESLLEAWVLLFALRCLGLSTIAVRSAAHAKPLGLRNVTVVATSAADDPSRADEIAADCGVRVVRVPIDLRDGASGSGIPATPEVPANGTGHILLTSGTTGDSKKVVRPAADEARSLPQRAVDMYGFTERSQVYVGNFPLWTAGGYRWTLIAWSAGATAILHQAPDLHRPLFRHSLTHIFATPASLYALMHAANGIVRRNDATRLFVTGGAMSKAMWLAAKRCITRQVSSMLASTEALVVAITPIETAEDLLWHRIDPSREVQVVDEQGAVLPHGHEGRVRIRIDDGLEGYLDDPVASRTFFRAGYFYPGDMGQFGADGRLSLRGRVSDVVNVLGIKVATGAIEQALQDRLGADGVCLLSIEGRGESPAGAEIHLLIQPGRKLASARPDGGRSA